MMSPLKELGIRCTISCRLPTLLRKPRFVVVWSLSRFPSLVRSASVIVLAVSCVAAMPKGCVPGYEKSILALCCLVIVALR